MGADGTAEVDFLVVAYREEGRWQVTSTTRQSVADLPTLLWTLRRQPGDAGALGMVSVGDDFFVLARVIGQKHRLLLSDATAAADWDLAQEVLDELDVPPPEEDDDGEAEPEPAGDLSIVADLGVSALDVGFICDDIDQYPEEMLTKIAQGIGFGREFRTAVETGSL